MGEANLVRHWWLPYRQLQSRHLGLVLAAARVVAWIGMLMIVGGIAYGIAAAMHGVDRSMASLALGTVAGLLTYGLGALLISGALAALVGIEESLRARGERE